MKRTSIFEGLNVKPVEPPSEQPQKSIFEGLDVKEQAPPEDTWGKRAARMGKSALAGGIGGLADTITSVYNIPAALKNVENDLRKNDPFEIDPVSGWITPRAPGERPALPLIPSAMEAIDKGIDHVTGDYTKTPEQEKWFHEGAKFAISMFSGGGLGSLAGKAGLPGIQAALKAVGSLKPSTLAGAAVSGAVLQKAEERQASAPVAFGSSLGAGLATQAALTLLNPKNILKKSIAAIGFGKNNLNIPAIDSANRLNIDLPGIAATKGVAPAFAHQTMSKFPYLGEALKEKIRVASEQYQKAWGNMLDSVGLPRETSQAIDKSYRLMRQCIPDGATTTPAPILEAIASIEGKMKTAVHSEPTKKLLGICQEFRKALAPPQPPLPEGFGKLPSHVQETILKALPVNEANPIPVQDLVRQKVELNKIMKDRNLFDRMDTDSLSFLHELREGVTKALDGYGKANPKFRQALKNADSLFAKVARREALDDALMGKVVDPRTGEVSCNGLLSLLTDRKQKKFLKNNLGEANYKKLEDFITVAKAMESIKKNNPNPSGSATMGAAIGIIASLLSGKLAVPATVIGGGTVATKLLTSKKFLNLATGFAKEPTEPLAKQLADIIKENTGMTIQALQKAMGDRQED